MLSPSTRSLRYFSALFASLFLTLSAVAVNAEGRHGQITVSGYGEVKLIPDRATLSLRFEQRGDDIDAIRRELDGAVSQLVQHLQDLGIDAKDIDSAHIAIQPAYRYDQQQQRRIADGYDINRSVTVHLRNLDTLGTVISDATRMGVNAISPPVLSSSGYEAAYQSALGKAVAQAKARAEAIAAAAGEDLGDMVSISSAGSHQPPLPVARMAMAADVESGGSYQPGEMQVSASVSATYGIE